MLTTGGQRPRGMGPFSERVFDVLEAYTVAPWNLLKSVCGFRGIDPLSMDAEQFEPLIERLREQVARMTDNENARELVELLRTLTAMPKKSPP